jgi:hypothetical protein
LVVEGEAEADEEEGVVRAVEIPAEVEELNVDADFVVDDDLDALVVLLPDAMIVTPVVAVEAEVEVVVTVVAIVVPVTEIATAVEVVTVDVLKTPPPGAICNASSVGDKRVEGSMQVPVKSPTSPVSQQK